MQNGREMVEIWLKQFYRSIRIYLCHFLTDLHVFGLILMGKPVWVGVACWNEELVVRAARTMDHQVLCNMLLRYIRMSFVL